MTKEQIDEIALRVANKSVDFQRNDIDSADLLWEYTHALLAELARVSEPVAYEYRTRYGETTTTPGWSEWMRVKPRNALCTMEDAVNELQQYIDAGYRYQLRELFTHPLPQPDLVAKIERLKAENAFQRSEHHTFKLGHAKRCQQLSEAQTRIELLEHDAKTGDYETLYEQTVVELSVSQASESELLNTLEVAADQIRKCDYTPARSTLLQAIADHKARKDGNESTICKTRHA